MELPHQEGDLLKNIPAQSSGPTLEELGENLRSLKRIIETSLIALAILACGVNAYMWRQSRVLSGQLVELNRFADDFQKTKEPTIRGFISSLQGYAKSHPDFQPILSKYLEPPSGKAPVSPVPPAAPKTAK